jgi:hypothetical protein
MVPPLVWITLALEIEWFLKKMQFVNEKLVVQITPTVLALLLLNTQLVAVQVSSASPTPLEFALLPSNVQSATVQVPMTETPPLSE